MNTVDRGGTLPASLRADCARCAGLCCVVPAFYSVQGFGFDKPARAACKHLTSGNRCAIHDQRAARGFGGCIGFDCYGAGQRVTQDLFGGADWRASEDVAARMFSAYERCVALHRLMALLALAESRAPLQLRNSLRARRAQLDALCHVQDVERCEIEQAQRETLALIRQACPTQAASAPARTLRPADRPR